MKLIGTMPFRNEQHALPSAVRAAMTWMDELVMLDHASTDQSCSIANALAGEFFGRIRIIRTADPVWHEMLHRQTMLNLARERGATHVAIVDADEMLTANLATIVRSYFADLKPGEVLQLPWVCLATPTEYFSQGVWWKNWVSMGLCDSPECNWRTAEDGYDFHHRHPRGSKPSIRIGEQMPGTHSGGLLHFQFVNRRRLKAKQALYKLTERLRWPDREPVSVVDARYNRAVHESHKGIGTSPVDPTWMVGIEPLWETTTGLDAIPPWQELEVQRILGEHGRDRFAGLDLFGL